MNPGFVFDLSFPALKRKQRDMKKESRALDEDDDSMAESVLSDSSYEGIAIAECIVNCHVGSIFYF